MKLIAEKLITHPVRGINKEAESLLLELLPSRDPSPSELQEIMNYIEPCRRRFVNTYMYCMYMYHMYAYTCITCERIIKIFVLFYFQNTKIMDHY